jgi:hypothetical protein
MSEPPPGGYGTTSLMGLVGTHVAGTCAKASAGTVPIARAKLSPRVRPSHCLRVRHAFNRRPAAVRFIFVSSIHKGAMPWVALCAVPLYLLQKNRLFLKVVYISYNGLKFSPFKFNFFVN